ncbi:MAG: glycosyltransferase family 39 protein [Candidatus Magasanikbacteria bacterium]|nr:glycosyltransferase family 39 protein [Candidatus Magasanikbacteria bacterium]
MTSDKKKIFSIIILSFFATVIYAFVFRIHPAVDARAYDQIALNLLDGKGYIEDATKPILHDLSIVRAGPGYEFLLAAIYYFFGHSYEAVWIFQALLHAVTTWLVYLIAKRLFNEDARRESIALISAILFGFWPDLVEISAMLMTETLYLFFTTLLVYVFIQVFGKPKNVWLAFLFGVITGLGILTRPTLLFFAPFFIFFYWRAKQPISIASYTLALVVSLLPWTLRNYSVYHQFILTTLIGEFNLWLGNTLVANGGQISGGYNPLDAFVRLNGASDLKDHAALMFKLFVLEYPGKFIELCFVRFVRYFSLIRPMGFWFYQTGISQGIFVASSAIWIAGVFLAGWSGFILKIRDELRKRPIRMSLFSYIIMLALTAPLPLFITVVQSRYRFQIYPFLAIFSGFTFVELYRLRKEFFKQKVIICVLFAFAFITFVDFTGSLDIIVERLSRFFA